MKSSNLIPTRILLALGLSLCFFTLLHSTLQLKASSPSISLNSCTYSDDISTIFISGTLQTDSPTIYITFWNDQRELVSVMAVPVTQHNFSLSAINKTLTPGNYTVQLSDYITSDSITTSLNIQSEHKSVDSTESALSTSTSSQTLLILTEILPFLSADQTPQTIDISLQNDTYIPELIFQIIQKKPITLNFILDNGSYWRINGLDIQSDQNNYIDLDIKIDDSYIPMDTVELLFPNTQRIPLHLCDSSSSSFMRTLFINTGQNYSGYYGKLYYYDPDANSFLFQDANIIQDDGTLSLRFQHTSDYVIIIDSTFLGQVSLTTSSLESVPTALDSVPQTGDSYFTKKLLFLCICSLLLSFILLILAFPSKNNEIANTKQKKTDE